MPVLINPFLTPDAFGGAAADAVSRFELGATQTQNSLDWWNGNPTDINAGVAAVNQAVTWKNHHICSFGCGVPEETIGVYDWEHACDERIPGSPATDHTWSNPDKLNLTMAMAPSWMTGGAASGTTDWDTINTLAVTSGNVASFAEMCRRAIARYTQCTAVHVWNELKGYWNAGLNRPDYEGYTAMYNAVYTAIKGERPAVQVGGPYPVVLVNGGTQSNPSVELTGAWGAADQRSLDVVKYWLQHKTGADFIALDGGNMVADNVELVTPMVAAETIVPAMVSWLRNLDPGTYPGCDTLPIVFAEWYIWGAHWLDAQPSHAQTAATWMVGTLAAVRAGVARAFIWEPMGDSAGDLAPYSPMGLVTDTRVSGGGDPTELQVVAKIIKDYFTDGAPLYDIDPGNSNIYALGTTTKAVLVNKTGSSRSTAGFDPATTLSAWEVKLVDWTPGT